MASESRRPNRSTSRQAEEERAAKITAVTERLNAAIGALTEGAEWTTMLRTSSKFHSYSFRNMMLLWDQATQRGMTPTAVAGFGTWRSLGRTVRKGEQGLAILAPITRRIADTDESEKYAGKRVTSGFRVVHVFDISQTDGKPLPDLPDVRPLVGEDVPGLWDSLADLIRDEGYVLQRVPEDDETQGWTNHTERIVSVRPDIDGVHATAVLVHELGHIRADHRNRPISRAQKETEAESIACVVLAAHGYDSTAATVPYVAGWSGGDKAVIAVAAETVHGVSGRILTDLAARQTSARSSEGHASAMRVQSAAPHSTSSTTRPASTRSHAGPTPSLQRCRRRNAHASVQSYGLIRTR